MECASDTSFLSSPDFLLLSCHILLFLDVPLFFYGAYCILFKTPYSMSSVKWLMFNLHIWSTILDLTLTLFGVPYILLPFPAGYGLGLIDAPEAMVYVGLIIVTAVDASIVLIYENRYFMLYARDSYWARVRKPCLAGIFIFTFCLCQPPFLLIPDQPTARKLVLDNLPCFQTFSFENREMFVLSTSWELPLIFLTVGFFILAPPFLSFFTLTFYHLMKSSTSVSFKTQKLQRQIIKALTLQSSFLIINILGPFFGIVITMILQYHHQGLNNLLFLVLSLHGIGSTIVLVLVHKPYREFTFYAICGRFKYPRCKQPRLFNSSFLAVRVTF
uniref:Serpentine Receptor, class H n=1 Tax=Caenorhabditis japonica TaxID=281687 RepID=A0A8R1DXK9_CAEJA